MKICHLSLDLTPRVDIWHHLDIFRLYIKLLYECPNGDNHVFLLRLSCNSSGDSVT